MKVYIALLCFCLFVQGVFAQAGCTDPNASNYNPSATTNNGSCSYPATSVSLTNGTALPAALKETSGLIYTDGGLWTLNDSGNSPAFYQIDESTGATLKTVNISNATNVDWEDLTADDTYFYIGDFGNNASGDRTDLKIYRVLKSSIGAG